MGLDFAQSEAHWSYSGFNRFRRRLAKADGYDLDEMWELEDSGKKSFKDLPMHDFYFHSDCDGKLTAKQMRTILPRFRELLKILEAEGQEDDYDVWAGNILADDMENCILDGEYLEFC